MGRRRDFDEFEETKEPVPRSSGGGSLVAATFIKYAAIVIVVLIVAYVVLRILGLVQKQFLRLETSLSVTKAGAYFGASRPFALGRVTPRLLDRSIQVK
jgi:hypothetical protein